MLPFAFNTGLLATTGTSGRALSPRAKATSVGLLMESTKVFATLSATKTTYLPPSGIVIFTFPLAGSPSPAQA